MSSNNKISNLVDSQLPFFVRNDHRTFVRFIESYYEYLEQSGKTLDVMKNVENYNDIDYTTDPFEEELYKQYLKLIPKDVAVDKRLLLKHVKDFYRARGTEKSIKFLLNILFGNADETSFYYPKDDILRASDGKWFIATSLRTRSFNINGVANTYAAAVQNFAAKTVTGNTSGAQANVERVDVYFEQGVQIFELMISGQTKEFTNGETLFTLFDEDGTTKSITANLFSGSLLTTQVVNGGSGYEVGDEVVIEGDGTGAEVIVQSVTAGNITSVGVLSGGAGFTVNNIVTFSGGGGAGANAIVTLVADDSSVHPNTYNIVYSTISLEANTAIGNAVYSNLVPAVSDPANNWVANSMSYFVYGNTGPLQIITLVNAGRDYSSLPTIDVQANTRIRSLGILGRMEIISGGVGYEANDKIHFTNVVGGYGTGALGNVATVNATGAITQVEFIEVPGHIIGGTGYSQTALPTATVVSANGSATGANVQVTAIIGDGESLTAVTGSIGVIQSLRIVTSGTGYSNATLNLTSIGDGTAQAIASIATGVFTYPGRWLNDDGHLSGYNFLEDRDYYQPFSYVVRTNKAFNDYRKPLKELIHPAGLKVFGEYLIEDNTSAINSAFRGTSSNNQTVFTKGTYETNVNSITITNSDHGYSTNDVIYLELVSGDLPNISIANGIHTISDVVDSNTFVINTLELTHEFEANTIITTGDLSIEARRNNAAFSCNITMPGVFSANGLLFEIGATVTGGGVGLVDNGDTLRFVAGYAKARDFSVSNTVVVDIETTEFTPGETGTLAWDIQVNPGRIRVWWNDVLLGANISSEIIGTSDGGYGWAGTDTGIYGNTSYSGLTTFLDNGDWPGSINSTLKIYTYQLNSINTSGNVYTGIVS